MTEEGEVVRIEAALHGDGWADQTSFSRELRAWARLAEEVNAYTRAVDDFMSDLCSRDYLEVMRARASLGLRNAIDQKLAPIDLSFRRATLDDTDERLAQSFAIESRDGWWWRRRPAAGPLAECLESDH